MIDEVVLGWPATWLLENRFKSSIRGADSKARFEELIQKFQTEV
jgi:hypothetical protein